MKKDVALSDFFRGFWVVSFTDSWCSAPTGELGNKLLKAIAWFDTMQWEREKQQQEMGQMLNFGSQSNWIQPESWGFDSSKAKFLTWSCRGFGEWNIESVVGILLKLIGFYLKIHVWFLLIQTF